MQNYQPELNFELIERIYLFAQRTEIIAVKFARCMFEFFNTVYRKRFLPLSPRYRIYGGPNIQIQHFLLNCFFFFSFFTLTSWSYSPQHPSKILMHERRPIWEAVSFRNTYFSLTWFLVTCGGLLAWQLLLSFLNELLLKNREKKSTHVNEGWTVRYLYF